MLLIPDTDIILDMIVTPDIDMTLTSYILTTGYMLNTGRYYNF